MRDVKAEVQVRNLEAGVHREATEDTASGHVLPGQLSMLSYGTQDFLSAVAESFHINRPSRKCPTDGNLAWAYVQLGPPFSDD